MKVASRGQNGDEAAGFRLPKPLHRLPRALARIGTAQDHPGGDGGAISRPRAEEWKNSHVSGMRVGVFVRTARSLALPTAMSNAYTW